MTRRSRRLRVWPVDKLQELAQLPAVRPARISCERCGHQGLWHFKRFGQCSMAGCTCWWLTTPRQHAFQLDSTDPPFCDTTV